MDLQNLLERCFSKSPNPNFRSCPEYPLWVGNRILLAEPKLAHSLQVYGVIYLSITWYYHDMATKSSLWAVLKQWQLAHAVDRIHVDCPLASIKGLKKDLHSGSTENILGVQIPVVAYRMHSWLLQGTWSVHVDGQHIHTSWKENIGSLDPFKVLPKNKVISKWLQFNKKDYILTQKLFEYNVNLNLLGYQEICKVKYWAPNNGRRPL